MSEPRINHDEIPMRRRVLKGFPSTYHFSEQTRDLPYRDPKFTAPILESFHTAIYRAVRAIDQNIDVEILQRVPLYWHPFLDQIEVFLRTLRDDAIPPEQEAYITELNSTFGENDTKIGMSLRMDNEFIIFVNGEEGVIEKIIRRHNGHFADRRASIAHMFLNDVFENFPEHKDPELIHPGLYQFATFTPTGDEPKFERKDRFDRMFAPQDLNDRGDYPTMREFAGEDLANMDVVRGGDGWGLAYDTQLRRFMFPIASREFQMQAPWRDDLVLSARAVAMFRDIIFNHNFSLGDAHTAVASLTSQPEGMKRLQALLKQNRGNQQ